MIIGTGARSKIYIYLISENPKNFFLEYNNCTNIIIHVSKFGRQREKVYDFLAQHAKRGLNEESIKKTTYIQTVSSAGIELETFDLEMHYSLVN